MKKGLTSESRKDIISLQNDMVESENSYQKIKKSVILAEI